MGVQVRKQDGKTFSLSASKSAFCIHPWRDRLRNLRIWLSWFWLMGYKKRTITSTFSRKQDDMAVNIWASTHTLIPMWRAEKPRFTTSPVCPFTSLVAAQSSSTMSVLLPSKSMERIINHFSTSCCAQTITYIRESFSPKRYRVLLCAKIGQTSTMKSNLPRNGPNSCSTINLVLPDFVLPTMRALNGIF